MEDHRLAAPVIKVDNKFGVTMCGGNDPIESTLRTVGTTYLKQRPLVASNHNVVHIPSGHSIPPRKGKSKRGY